MFLKHRFGPVLVQGAQIPRVFAYENILDSIDDMKKPGYFNDQRIVLRPNSRIDVIASDCHGSLFVAGLINEQICVYKDDIRTPRGEIIMEPAVVPQVVQNAKSHKKGRKRSKAAA